MQHRCHYLSLYCNNSTSSLISLVLYPDEIPCLELETCFFLFFFQLVRRYHLIKILQTIQPRLTPQFLAEYFSHHTIKHQKHHSFTQITPKEMMTQLLYNPITNKRFTRVNCLVIWHPSRRLLARLQFLSKWKMQRGGEWWSRLE